MKPNIGMTDRLIRLSFSIIFFLAAWWFGSWILLLIGLFTFYEALASWCILYQLIGKNTCTISSKKD